MQAAGEGLIGSSRSSEVRSAPAAQWLVITRTFATGSNTVPRHVSPFATILNLASGAPVILPINFRIAAYATARALT